MGVELARVRGEFREMEDVNFSDSDVVYHIRDALTSVSQGERDSYDELVGVIHHKEHRASPDEVALLVTCLKGLSGAVAYIDVVLHHALLDAIFSRSLWNCGADVIDALVELILSLAASNGKYLDSCLTMLVSNFMPPYSFIDILQQPRGLARKDQVLSRIHSALKDISHLVPLAPLRLEMIVLQRIPSNYMKEPMLSMYVQNMLKLESGAMGEFVGRKVLTAVVDKLVDLDVEIGWDDILREDFSKGIFEMEIEDVEENADDLDEEVSEFPTELSRRSLGGNVVAEKLDSLMVLIFEHLESCEAGGRLIPVFDTLLQSFQKTVLTAYKSKFAQFVMFYACALDPEVCGLRFATTLVDTFICASNPPHIRMSAVAYLASYLARGKFLSASLVAAILKRLVDWCLVYCRTPDADINPITHKVFYSACQGIMYVLCFRMKSMMDVPWLKSQLLQMSIGSILTHRLSPLRVCLPSVVEEFLRQARAARLFTSESSNSTDLLESELSKAFGGMERLDMFFPFDPCLLKKCDRYIRPHFVFWSMVRPTYAEEEEESSDEDVAVVFPDGNEEEEEARDVMGRSYNEQDYDIDEFDSALDKMSITPRNSLRYSFGGGLQLHTRMPSKIRPSTSPESL